MPEILRTTNPVPGHDSTVTNRNLPVSPENTQIQNVVDPNRVTRSDNRTEQQDAGQSGAGQIRYDSNFQTFVQRLRDAPNALEELARFLSGREGTVVLSGLSEGMAKDISQILQMLRMDQDQLLAFLTDQARSGTRFGGPLFSLLRNAYARISDEGLRQDILQFLKIYSDYSSTGHLEGNLLRGLRNMGEAMPASWAARLNEFSAQLASLFRGGDRAGALALLRQQVIPYMSSYVDQTHDLGVARSFLTLLTLDMARYENGTVDNLLQAFHRLSGSAALKEQLGGLDDRALLGLLRQGESARASAAGQFANLLSSAAGRALRGEGDFNTNQMFQNLVNAMLINESVYMPVNHFLIPLDWNGKMMFSELWVDPNAEDRNGSGGGNPNSRSIRMLVKMDIQDLGLFDVIVTSRQLDTEVRISCPERVAPFAGEIESSVSQILVRSGLTPTGVTVRKMERPLTLTEVFPQIFERKNSINVKA